MSVLQMFLIQFLVVFYVSNVAASSTQETAAALLKWKASFVNPDHYLLGSWTLSPNASAVPCTWFGVSCINGIVNKLNLTNLGINGTLYSFPFLSLTNLQYLDLSMNEFYGEIPSQIANLTKLIYLDLSVNYFSGPILSEIGLLAYLQTIHFAENHLNGSIPRKLGDLSNLTLLYLYDNELSGPITPEIGKIHKLVELDLGANQLTGPIPTTFGNLTNLVMLNLSENQLSGSLPPELGEMKSLQKLSLQRNNFSGSIPSSLGYLRSLTLLQLYANNLSGSIPKEIGNLIYLTHLELNMNQLSGPIPASFGNLSNLEILRLRENQLSGSLPQELGKLDRLVVLEIDENSLSGPLPENLCRAGTLQNFTASNNTFTGLIPEGLRNCSGLVRISLSNNRLTGNLSEDLGVYPELLFMDLSNNRFYGQLPSKWGSSKKLRILLIAKNNITGSIPAHFGSITQLGRLDLSSNHLVGEIPREFGNLISLFYLYLNDNELSGAIPLQLGSALELLSLDLSKNKLNGSIPASFGVYKHLYSMNLSNNELSQQIPIGMGNLSQVSVLDLSHNQLNGEIPSELFSLQNLLVLNLSHNGLSGLIPQDVKTMSGLEYIDLSYNKLEGPIPNNKAFANASLAGNKGLCGNIKGFQPCKTPRPLLKGYKLVLIIVLPLLGALLLLGAFIKFLFLCEQKTHDQDEQCYSNKANNLRSVLFMSPYDRRTMYSDIVKATENFNPEFIIGNGGHGNIYKANLPSGEILAVKRFHSSSEPGNCVGFLNEIRALMDIKHRNIVKLHCFISTEQDLLLVCEYLQRGSLANLLNVDEQAKYLDWLQRVRIIDGVALALSYMHHDCSPPIVHLDISSKNILLDFNFEARISDFGTAKLLKLDSPTRTMFLGTKGYIAPELAYTARVSTKCDVFSFGVLMLEVIKGEHPGEAITSLARSSAGSTKLKDLLDQRLPYPVGSVERELTSIVELARCCLNANPKLRPNMETVSSKLSQSVQAFLGFCHHSRQGSGSHDQDSRATTRQEESLHYNGSHDQAGSVARVFNVILSGLVLLHTAEVYLRIYKNSTIEAQQQKPSLAESRSTKDKNHRRITFFID